MTSTQRSSRVRGALRARCALLRQRRQDGFTLIEALGAVVLFVIVATSMAGVLVSAIKTNGTARERTQAQQLAQAQIETIRRLPYDKVGIKNGNPPGVLDATRSVTVGSSTYTVNIAVKYVGDNVPTSYPSGADYKRVTVTVLRPSDSKLLAKDVTYVSSPARAPLGGVNNAIINVQVVDYALNTPVQGANVNLTSTNPSANLNDTTDDTGSVSFPALTPNPTSNDFYDITASLTGYVTLKDDLPPSAATHHSLAPSETFNTKVRIYRPATINVVLKNADGSAFTGNATVTVSSSRGSQDFSYAGSALSITAVNGEPIVPSLQYTVSANTGGGLVATPVTKYVPDNYPNVLSTTFTLTFPAPSALVVTVTQGGVGVQGATVTVTDGGAVNVTGTTDSSFTASFSAINPGTYTVTATSLGQSGSVTATTTAGNTTYVTIDLPAPATIVATVTWAGQPAGGVTVTLTGGPKGVSLSGVSDAAGQVRFSNLPPGSGYTVTATKAGASASQSNITAPGGATTPVTLVMPTASLRVTVTWGSGGPLVQGATVTLTGGPMGTNVSGTTNQSGQVLFVNVPQATSGTLYSVTATHGGRSGAVSSVTVPAGGQAVTVALSVSGGKTLTVNVKRSGSNVSGAMVALIGGPSSITLIATTDGSGNATFTNVPTGSNYTLKAWNCSFASSRSTTSGPFSVNSSSTQNLTLTGSTCPLTVP